MEVKIEREAAPLDVLAEEPRGVGFVDRPLEAVPGLRIFVAEIEVGGGGPRRVGRKDDPLNHLVRVVLHQDPIVERPRFALVGIDAEVDRARVILGEERPLEPGGESGAAPTAKAGSLHQFDHISRLLLLEHPLERRVAAAAAIARERVAPGNADGFEKNRLESGHGIVGEGGGGGGERPGNGSG